MIRPGGALTEMAMSPNPRKDTLTIDLAVSQLGSTESKMKPHALSLRACFSSSACS